MLLSTHRTNALWRLRFLGEKIRVNCMTRMLDWLYYSPLPSRSISCCIFCLCLCVWVLAININETFFSWPDSQRKGEKETMWYSGSSLTFRLFESFWYKWNPESRTDAAYETGSCIVRPAEISGESKIVYESCCACTSLMWGSGVAGIVVIVQFIINRISFAWLP